MSRGFRMKLATALSKFLEYRQERTHIREQCSRCEGHSTLQHLLRNDRCGHDCAISCRIMNECESLLCYRKHSFLTDKRSQILFNCYFARGEWYYHPFFLQEHLSRYILSVRWQQRRQVQHQVKPTKPALKLHSLRRTPSSFDRNDSDKIPLASCGRSRRRQVIFNYTILKPNGRKFMHNRRRSRVVFYGPVIIYTSFVQDLAPCTKEKIRQEISNSTFFFK